MTTGRDGSAHVFRVRGRDRSSRPVRVHLAWQGIEGVAAVRAQRASVLRDVVAIAVFALTYLLISGRQQHLLPLNRPASALLGAVLMVGGGVLTHQQACAAVDHDTIVLLLGMMIVTSYLKLGGFFEWTAAMVVRRARHPRTLLAVLIAVSGVLSALLVNDTVCLMLTPLVVGVIVGQRAIPRLPLLPYLLALAMSANIGSVATLVGNPQCMIIGSMSHVSFVSYARVMTPVAIVNLLVLYGLLVRVYGAELDAVGSLEPVDLPPLDTRLVKLTGCVMLAVLVGFVTGHNLAWTALAGAAVLMVTARRDTHAVLALVDWNLLLFFSALFVVVAGLNQTGLPDHVHEALAPLFTGSAATAAFHFTWFSILGSNLFSNVPYVLVAGHWLAGLSNAPLMWRVLALSTTFAGNLTILGSVANVIVMESARGHVEVGFWDYARFGIPVTLVSVAIGLAMILALR